MRREVCLIFDVTNLKKNLGAGILKLPLNFFLGVQQGPVMLTAKNLQCMRALLVFAHSQGSILGSSWLLVLTTIQVAPSYTTDILNIRVCPIVSSILSSILASRMDIGFETFDGW